MDVDAEEKETRVKTEKIDKRIRGRSTKVQKQAEVEETGETIVQMPIKTEPGMEFEDVECL